VLPVAADLDPFAGEAGLDGGLYGFGCRHVGFKIRLPRDCITSKGTGSGSFMARR